MLPGPGGLSINQAMARSCSGRTSVRSIMSGSSVLTAPRHFTETRKMPTHHVATHRGFPTVTPARALADVAAREPTGRVERWLDLVLTAEDLPRVFAEPD